MLVLAIQNTKGGATKSTTAVNLGRAYQRMGFKVAYGETDPQGSLREWYADNRNDTNDQPIVVKLSGREQIHGARDNPAFEGVEILIIDGEAAGISEFIAVTKIADMVLIVSQPSPSDIKPIGEMVDVLEGKPNIKTAFLLTRTKKGDDLVQTVRELLSGFGHPVLENTIRDLKGFKTSFGAGQTVFEFNDYKHAQEDVIAVANEIFKVLEVN